MKIDQVTEAEISVLQVLWEHGEATSRTVTSAIYDEISDSKIATSQKLLERLEAKGCVCRDRNARAHVYRPLVSREQFLQDRMQSLADRVCQGTLMPLMTTLLKSKGLSRNDRLQLRELVNDLWPAKKQGVDPRK